MKMIAQRSAGHFAAGLLCLAAQASLAWSQIGFDKGQVLDPQSVLKQARDAQGPNVVAGVRADAVRPLFSPGGNVDKEILSRLDRARRSLDIAMYSFSHPSLVAKVKALARNGIKVRLVLHDAHKNPDAKAFEEAGVDVRYVTPIMHHKFAIIDGPQKEGDSPADATLLTGSGNWSSSSAHSYDEDFLAFEAESAPVSAFSEEFNFLWSRSRDIPGPVKHAETVAPKTPGRPPVVFTSANMEARRDASGWTFRSRVPPEQGIAGRTIVEAMDSAKISLRIATAHFRRRDFFEALSRALARGVKVRMILDQQEYSGAAALKAKKPADAAHLDEFLGRMGAEIRYKAYSRVWQHQTAKQMHAKYMIVDDNLVCTGSFNWSDNAETQTMENLVRLEGPGVKAYGEHFESIIAYGLGNLEALLAQIKARDGQGPCHFDPISLTAEEMRRLRAGYAFGACR